MTRVATFNSQQMLLAQMMKTQSQVNQAQTQVNTGQKSQDYTGLADDSFRLINFENQRSRLDRYIKDNTVANMRIDAMGNSVDSAQKSLTEFKKILLQFASHDYENMSDIDAQSLSDMRSQAYVAMKDLQYYLNVSVDGRYLFGGGKTDVEPVNLPWGSADEFAKVFDGNNVTYPETRAANLVDTDFDGRTINPSDQTVGGTSYGLLHDTSGITSQNFSVGNPLDGATYGQLSLFPTTTADTTKGLIVSDQPDAFSGLSVGMTFLLNDGNAVEDTGGTPVADRQSGVYTITGISRDGKTLTVEPPPPGTNSGVDPVQIPSSASSKITLTVPEGTRVTVKNSQGQDDDYTVHWPSNADLTAAGYDLTSTTDGLTDIITGKRLFVTPPFNSLGAGFNTSQTNVTVETSAYYKGDTLELTHRVDETRTLTLGLNALDPAFEKAIRGLGMLAQGAPLDLVADPSGKTIDGTELRRRVDTALGLISDALKHSTASNEEPSDFTALGYQLAGNEKMLTNAISDGNDYLTYLDNHVGDIEGIDTMEAAVRLNSSSQALEASYSAMSKVSKLSLLNYL